MLAKIPKLKYSFLLIFLLYARLIFGQSNIDTYKFVGGYFEYTISLNKTDNSFSYSKIGDMIYERSYGHFNIKNDSIILNSSDTSFYKYNLSFDSTIKDSLKLISKASESHHPIFGRINGEIVFFTDSMKMENDSIFGISTISKKDFNPPILLQIDPEQKNLILIESDKNVVSFESWFGGWKFREFNNEVWIISKCKRISNPITESWDEISKKKPNKKSYFKKTKN